MIYFLLLVVQIDSYGSDCAHDPFCSAYTKALNTAKYPSKSREINYLRALRPDNSRLTFDSSGRVLLSRVDKSVWWNYTKGDLVVTSRQGWYTAFPDLKEGCSRPSLFNKTTRIQQILGLPPTATFDTVLEVFVPLTGIFRPCPDPEIYDNQCVSSIPLLNYTHLQSGMPWFCPVGKDLHQVSEKWVEIKSSHFDWMCSTWKNNYLNNKTYSNYPWTALGYTYDWGSEDGVGLSEFIVDKGVEILFKGKYSIEDYCNDTKKK